MTARCTVLVTSDTAACEPSAIDGGAPATETVTGYAAVPLADEESSPIEVTRPGRSMGEPSARTSAAWPTATDRTSASATSIVTSAWPSSLSSTTCPVSEAAVWSPTAMPTAATVPATGEVSRAEASE